MDTLEEVITDGTEDTGGRRKGERLTVGGVGRVANEGVEERTALGVAHLQTV